MVERICRMNTYRKNGRYNLNSVLTLESDIETIINIWKERYGEDIEIHIEKGGKRDMGSYDENVEGRIGTAYNTMLGKRIYCVR